MSEDSPTTPITIRTSRQMVAELDALASAMDRSRNYVVKEALQQYLATHAWQAERIEAGLEDVREGRIDLAEQVFSDIAARHGWKG